MSPRETGSGAPALAPARRSSAFVCAPAGSSTYVADVGSIGSGPCVMNCNNLQGDIYSFHTGGANVVFADGSVRFIKESININTLAALVTKAAGEIVANDY